MAGWQLRVASNAAASAWTDITGAVERTTARFTGQAFDGQIGQGGVDFDDPDGTAVVPGYRVWELNKDGLVLERGRIGIRDYERGVQRTGDSHERDLTLIDCNADLSRVGVHGWSRPAETGYARVLALIADFLDGSPRASTVIGSLWVRNANTRTMPAKRYDNANPHEVLMDCATVEAKVFWVTVADDGSMDLFYDISTYTGYAAGISITDDDPDLVTEFPPVNPTASRDPEELFSNVRLTYGLGTSSVTADDAGVATDHDYLETIYHDDKATAGTAQYRADRFLDIHDEEEVTRRCSVYVPEDKLDLIRRGMTISYRSAATNDLTPITRRIAQLTWAPPIADGQDWTAILELDWPLKMGQRYTKPPPPNPALVEAIEAHTTPYIVGNCPVNTLTVTLLASVSHNAIDESTKTINFITVAVTDFMVVLVTTHAVGGISVSSPSGLTPHPNNGMAVGSAQVHMFHKRGVGSSENITIDFSANTKYDITIRAVTESNYEAAASGSGTGTAIDFGPITGEYGEHVALVGGAIVGTPGTTITPDAGTDVITEGNSLDGTVVLAEGRLIHEWPDEFINPHQIEGTMSGSATYAALTLAFSGESCAPMDGSPVPDEEVGTGDGVTVTFFTAVPWEPGSLDPKVDGLSVLADLLSTDPPNRSFTLSFAPSGGTGTAPAETVTADYITDV